MELRSRTGPEYPEFWAYESQLANNELWQNSQDRDLRKILERSVRASEVLRLRLHDTYLKPGSYLK